MERPVKERLVGAAVLMAAAIILIPEMLSGPDRESTQKSADADEGAIKTYTIDLNHPPGTPAASNVTEEAAPPPEQSPERVAAAEQPPARAVPRPFTRCPA